jgi:hypothetical protein
MKPVITGMLFLLFGVTVPAFAQEEHHEENAKPAQHEEEAKPAAKQEEAKPAAKQEKPAKQEQAKPAKEEKAAKPEKQEAAKPPAQHQEVKAQGQYAHDGQKDSHGHVYTASRFGPDHHARFEASGGRLYNGRREYSYGGYWFYAGAYPPWFYQQDVYFVMGPDGLWYAVAYGNPSLTFQVNIE